VAPGAAPSAARALAAGAAAGRALAAGAAALLPAGLTGRLSALSRGRLAALAAAGLLLAGAAGTLVARRALGVLHEPPVVVAVRAGPAMIDDQPGGVGTISASPGGSVAVSLDVVGVTAPIVVEQVLVLNGSPVGVGTPLVELDPTALQQNLGQLRLDLAEARASLAAARRAERLAPVTSGSVTGAYIALQVPQLAGEVSIDEQLLQIGLGNTASIRSPVAGVANGVRVVPGQVVVPGQPLLDVVNTSNVDVSTGVQLGDLASIRAGDPATITPAAIPGTHLSGRVVTTSPTTTGGGLEGTVTVEARNGGRDPLPLGTQVFVSISAPARAAVALPLLAVINLQLDPAVFVVSHGRAELQTVSVGAAGAQNVQIVSGLRAGAEVAETNLQTLRNGSPVRVEAVRS
jgi:RND family efflux transporter MFP subunit